MHIIHSIISSSREQTGTVLSMKIPMFKNKIIFITLSCASWLLLLCSEHVSWCYNWVLSCVCHFSSNHIIF